MFGSCCNLVISVWWLQPAASSVSAAESLRQTPKNHASEDAGTMDTAVAGVAPAYSCIHCLQRYCTLAHQSINQTVSCSMSVKWNSTSPVNWMMSSLLFCMRIFLRLLRFMMRPIIKLLIVPWVEIASLVASKDIVLLSDQSISLSVLFFYFTS
jgi:hypothetical protein